jgi:chromosome segregation ATPase
MANDNDIIARLKVEGLNQFKAELAQSSKSADGTTTAVQRMEKAIADATDPKDVQRLTKELEAVKVATEASQTAFESSKAKLRAYKEEATGLATILATMKSEGKQNTQTFKDIEKQFEATKKKAGQLSDQINDINQEIKSLGSDTRGIDNVVRGATLMANSFQLATGVQALFGKENKALTEGLLKLNGIMAVTQSIQQIGNELTREDSIVKQAASKATAFYATTMEMATGAVKLFRIALMGLGIGAVIFAVYELTKGFFGLGEQVEDNTKKQKENNDAIQESIDLIKERQREEQLGYNRIGGLYLQNGKLRKKTLEQQLKDALEIQEKWRQTTEFASTDSAEKFKEYLRKNGQEILAADKNVADLQKAIEDRNRESERKRKEAEKKRSGEQAQKIKQDIEELEILESFDKNSQRAIQAQIEWYEQLRSVLDITSQEYKDLGELIDLLQKKLAGKQKIEPIDLSGALKGIDPKTIEKRPLTLYERIFGSREENVDAQKRIENQVKGSLKIVSEINKYGQQISSIAEQAMSCNYWRTKRTEG